MQKNPVVQQCVDSYGMCTLSKLTINVGRGRIMWQIFRIGTVRYAEGL